MLELLDGAQDPEARAKLLSSLVRADKAGLAAIARDEACMQTFHMWLRDLIADKPAFHVLELLLKACPAFSLKNETFLDCLGFRPNCSGLRITKQRYSEPSPQSLKESSRRN